MISCVDCGAGARPVEEPRCSSCHRLQPLPAGVTHFDTLGLPTTFALTQEQVDSAFRSRSLQVHPDRFSRAGDHVRRISVERTAALTEAHRVLKDAEARAHYLLTLAGTSVDATPDPVLLADLMEAREAAEESPDARAVLAERTGAQRALLFTALGAAFADVERDGALGDRTRLVGIGTMLGRIRYLTRLWEDLRGLREHSSLHAS